MKLINIGFGNLVSSDKLIAVVAPDAAPVKRIVQEAKSSGMLVVLSAVSCETIQNRAEESEDKDD